MKRFLGIFLMLAAFLGAQWVLPAKQAAEEKKEGKRIKKPTQKHDPSKPIKKGFKKVKKDEE